MLKKILCLVLAVTMVVGVLALTSCGQVKQNQLDERLPMTISVLGITTEETTDEAVEAVEKAINDILGMTYNTHIDLSLVTADEYMDLINERVEIAVHNNKLDSAVLNYNNAALNKANSAIVTKNFGKWQTVVSGVEATTITTREQYTELRTELNEHNILEVVYPDAASPIDVVMVIGKDMYKTLSENGVLQSIKSNINTDAYTKFSQYIYPTYIELLQAITGDIMAVPNNNLLAEYTYVVVNKNLADKYELNIDTVDNYDDFADFLSEVKANESVVPMANVPDALGVFELFTNEEISIGTYCDPLIGYSEEDGSSYYIDNIFDIPEYIAHQKLMGEYKEAGYFESKSGSEDFAVKVVKGDASVPVVYGSDYYVKVVQNPFVNEDAIFNGMFGVSAYTSNVTRSLEFILELSTNPEIRNIFQYGIEGVNYSVNEDGTITRLNDTYIMDNATTGNVYMGYPEEGMLPDQWNYVKQTNLDSLLNPYLTYTKNEQGGYDLLYYIDDAKIESVLDEAVKVACLRDAFTDLGLSYDEYIANVREDGTLNTISKRIANNFKTAAKYKETFISGIMAEAKCDRAQAEKFMSADASQDSAKFKYEWYFDTVVKIMREERYSTLLTSTGLDSAVLAKIASLAGTTAEKFTDAQKKAETYYSNIDTLRIMARLVMWDNLSEEEWQKYENMGAQEFESAVFDFVRTNYIEENQIDDEKYDEIVKAFIVSQLSFADKNDNSTYKITWDQYQETKESAQESFAVIETLKTTYNDLLVSYLGSPMMVSMYGDNEIPALVHEALYSKWLSENGYKKTDFETEIYNELLSFLDMTYSEFTSYRRKDTTKFTELMKKIKEQYKDILISEFSITRYKNDNIDNDTVLKTLLNVTIEERTQITKTICDAIGLSESEYQNSNETMEKFIMFADQMRTKFVYTLLTKYTNSQINGFAYNDIDGIVYDIIHESGFYTNEICKYICTDLSTYMTKKSDAKTYNDYVAKIVGALGNSVDKYGYKADTIKGLNTIDAYEALYEVVVNEYFGNTTSVLEMLNDLSSEYFAGVSNTNNMEEYLANAATEINNNALYASIVEILAKGLDTALKAEDA